MYAYSMYVCMCNSVRVHRERARERARARARERERGRESEIPGASSQIARVLEPTERNPLLSGLR